MNFNFNEYFFQSSNFNLFYDLGITFIGAFFGFLAALLVNRLIDKKNQKKEEAVKKQGYLSHLLYFLELIESILKNYPKQAEDYKNLSIEVINNPFELQKPLVRATYDLSRLKDMDSSELRDAYFYFFRLSQDSNKNYRRIFANVDFLLMYFDDLMKQNVNHRNFIHKDQLFVRDCIEEISNRLGFREKNIQVQHPGIFDTIREYQYLHHFSGVFIRLAESKASFKAWKEDYLEPLHSSILKELVDSEFDNSVFLLLKKALGRLKYIEFNSLEFAVDMKNVEANIESAIEELTSINNTIKRKTC